MPPSHISVGSIERGSYPHVIRLRGPWQFSTIPQLPFADSDGGHEEVEHSQTVGLPCDLCELLGDDYVGQVQLSRRFGLPTKLEPDEQIGLVVRASSGFGQVRLNGEDLGSLDDPTGLNRFDVTEQLQTRNELVIEVTVPSDLTTGRREKCAPPYRTIDTVHLEIDLKKPLQET